MERVLLLGGSGLVGTELQRRWNLEWGQLIVADRSTDITGPKAVLKIFLEQAPTVVINCAAVSGVDASEKDPLRAFDVNGHGPEVLAAACRAKDAILIHLSTDYVFPSMKDDKPFTEKDFPNPVNEYGRSKWEGEKRIMTWSKHYILRTSSLYGNGRSTHAAWVLEALKTGQPVKISDDMWGSPTYIGDLVEWIGKLILKKPAFGIYHLCHSGYCSRYDFAKKLCQLKKAKKPYPIEKVSWKTLNLPAVRPSMPLLSKDKWQKAMGKLPTWEEGLKRYLAEAEV